MNQGAQETFQNKSLQGDHAEGPYTSIRLLERAQANHRTPPGPRGHGNRQW